MTASNSFDEEGGTYDERGGAYEETGEAYDDLGGANPLNPLSLDSSKSRDEDDCGGQVSN